jgi:hypothetical protein
MTSTSDFLSKTAASLYAAWGAFHVYVAWQIYALALSEQGIAQGRLLQLAAYMLTISLFAIVIAIWRVAKNDPLGFWLNLGVVGWADVIWVLVVVLPGYVPLVRGLLPPAVFVLAAVLSAIAYSRRREQVA